MELKEKQHWEMGECGRRRGGMWSSKGLGLVTTSPLMRGGVPYTFCKEAKERFP
jgi:hypothetical protein